MEKIISRDGILDEIDIDYHQIIIPILEYHNLPTNLDNDTSKLEFNFNRMCIFYWKLIRIIKQDKKIGRTQQTENETYWRLYKNYSKAKEAFNEKELKWGD